MTNHDTNSQRSWWKTFLIYHLPTIAYAVAIISVSSITNLSPLKMRKIAFDKVAHFIEYAIFAFLVFRSLSHVRRSISTRAVMISSAVFLTCFATMDEIYQRFVPGRQMDPLDWAVDIVGALLVLSLLGYRRKSRLNDLSER